ncbi:MAG: alpha amylase C-terminal domain-containing protein [Phycisphaerae bacterium]|nr:alpha amylase C-terminal domain-containing protein [Phycisphaerae bacterium]
MTPASEPRQPDGTGLIELDKWLEPYADKLRDRYAQYQQALRRIVEAAGSLEQFSQAYSRLGFNRGEHEGEPGVWYREWAPNAIALSLIGDFNNWDRMADPLHPNADGVWSLFLPDAEYAERLTHGSRVKVHVHSKIGPRDRIPAFIRRAVYDPDSHDFCGQYWNPPEPYVWRHQAPQNVAAGPRTGRTTGKMPVPQQDVAAGLRTGRTTGKMPVPQQDVAAGPRTGRTTGKMPVPQQDVAAGPRTGRPTGWKPVPQTDNLRVYEAHVGMAVEEERIGTYAEFTEDVLPRIAAAGYNAVQLMAIQEHPYYGSFGYQVSSFFAASSRFGTPEELMALIDAAHGHGLLVFLDLVHSHAVKNMNEGLNHFDGTEYQYFHAGGRGQHPAWDSLCFDYAKLDVLRFLLGNVRFWLEEYRFDGFRFDGVTSMMYLDHGLSRHFTGYDDYFPPHVDEDAITYLQLANELVHELRPEAVTVAEDVSGMVGIARPVAEGGLGFDYRLAMGIPDYWIKLLKEKKDEEWSMGDIYHTLTNRRVGEKHIAYAESHDQALVGDKTIAMRLIDADIYWHMTKGTPNLIVDRGMALHKMIRLITFSLGGEGYLNFMGNEFGHPEWIDFPREGNNFSYHYARRQWSLADDPLLRYHALAAFDRAMVRLDLEYDLLAQTESEPLHIHEDEKLLIYRRGPLVFAFNLHPHQSYPHYRIGVPSPNDYKLMLNTDDIWFGGHGEVLAGQCYPWQNEPWHDRPQSIQIYLPARTALVLAPA